MIFFHPNNLKGFKHLNISQQCFASCTSNSVSTLNPLLLKARHYCERLLPHHMGMLPRSLYEEDLTYQFTVTKSK